MLKRTAALTISALLASAALAQNTPDNKPQEAQPVKVAAKKLAVGDAAPTLAVEKWVKGDPITGFEKGQVYVVEFWATWCGPCIASMPHLTELQKEYKAKGVRIVGVTTKDKQGNTLDAVESMVKDKGDGAMGYTVAWDTDTQTSDAFLKASGQRGIPASFLVDGQGKIAYIGHPMWLDKPLKEVVAGTWNPKTGMAAIEKAEEQLDEIAEQLDSDPKAGIKALDEFSADYPAAAEVLSDKAYTALLKAGMTERATQLGNKLVAKAVAAKNPVALNEVAWALVDPEGGVTKPDLEFALTTATSACELSKWKRGDIIDTLARVYFLKGDTAKAVEFQKKAVENSGGNAQMKAELEKTLKEYEAAAAKGNK